ncbi:holocytochrome-c synthase [Dioszegia hungarica]|uniref:Holocytochrome c-type synthase n=1 Tax=Dioszegia hungarica TaxID=4972 RepID=A0AA38LY68_9TREE|nr:holocytochrome-c synthase [Dioszegia hungarica]KAI9639538.1 holocytochrome-c synthase [Dioszegia hungarica]
MVSFNLFSTGNAAASGSTSAAAATASSIPSAPVESAEKCPVDHETRSKWLAANPSTSAHPFNPAAPSSSTTSARSGGNGTTRTLSHDRVISSIPRAATSYPSPEGSVPHIPTPSPSSGSEAQGSSAGYREESTGKWVYPSEHQFFQALQRKNHNPNAKDMRTVVPIHNAVNEKTWEEVLAWEAGMGGEACGGIRLISFAGRPKDLTPKAWFKTLAGYAPPFDRHDWLIDRCGTTVRYVIDYYTGKQDPNKPDNIAFHLDVRPALDSWEGVRTRVMGMWR